MTPEAQDGYFSAAWLVPPSPVTVRQLLERKRVSLGSTDLATHCKQDKCFPGTSFLSSDRGAVKDTQRRAEQKAERRLPSAIWYLAPW